MSDILTQSFCERCGTEYTFGDEAERRPTYTRFVTVARGLRNYVLSDDPLSTAFARARQEGLAAQLDAFDRTFHFCIECRQYVCLRCWNDEAGRCQSCVPLPASTAETEATSVAPLEAAADQVAPGPTTASAEPEAGPEEVAERVAGARATPDLVPDLAPPAHVVVVDVPPPVDLPVAVPMVTEKEKPGIVGETPAPAQTVAADVGPSAAESSTAAMGEATAGTVEAMPAAAEFSRLVPETPPESAGVAPTHPSPAPGTCPSCGLAISRAARFCRRCGAPQGEEVRAVS